MLSSVKDATMAPSEGQPDYAEHFTRRMRSGSDICTAIDTQTPHNHALGINGRVDWAFLHAAAPVRSDPSLEQ
jgi:hypothetical protein